MQRVQPQPFRIPQDTGRPTVEPVEPVSTPAEPRFLVDWVDGHREAAELADPAYPGGCAIDVALDAPKACRVQLPYPAARCGTWVVTCRVCLYAIALATAGRSDDPSSVRVPCKV
jgi:hypothetical protein